MGTIFINSQGFNQSRIPMSNKAVWIALLHYAGHLGIYELMVYEGPDDHRDDDTVSIKSSSTDATSDSSITASALDIYPRHNSTARQPRSQPSAPPSPLTALL